MGLLTLLLVGSIAVTRLPIEFLPQMDYPFIGVYVPYPNSIPSHVEKRITKPIEEVLSTLGDVKRIMSTSTSDDAFVGVLFNWGRDISVLRLEVKEKIDSGINIAVIDSRDYQYYQQAHIAGAITLPLSDMDEPYMDLKGFDEIVTYCT